MPSPSREGIAEMDAHLRRVTRIGVQALLLIGAQSEGCPYPRCRWAVATILDDDTLLGSMGFYDLATLERRTRW